MPTAALSPCTVCKHTGCTEHVRPAWRSRYQQAPQRITGRALTRLRQALWDREQGRCQGCRRPVLLTQAIRDHIVPLAEGTRDEPNNLNCQLLCRDCNKTKTDADAARGTRRHRGV